MICHECQKRGDRRDAVASLLCGLVRESRGRPARSGYCSVSGSVDNRSAPAGASQRILTGWRNDGIVNRR